MEAFVLGDGRNAGKVAVIQNKAPVKTEDHRLSLDNKFVQFWDLMDTIKVHGYLRAAMSVIGRSSVGTWWKLKKHPDRTKEARVLHKRRLLDFYYMSDKPWDNIKDFYGMPYKLLIAAMYLKYFGQAAFHIVRDGYGDPMGLDFLHGYVVPNVDEAGYFKNPAFYQYLTNDKSTKIEYTSAEDIVYILNPDWEGYPVGSSDIQSITDFALPLDIYLQTAAREYVRNRSKPEAFYILSPDISNEAFDNFVEALDARYAGAANVGKNPVVVRGELDIKELSRLPSDLPYQESRQDTRTEALAVSGVPSAKLGIEEDITAGGLRELRREFHETTMLPLFKMIEDAFYSQVHLRAFGIKGWLFSFNSPDFLTAVERATVDMRYFSIGVYNPNEIRGKLGEEPRDADGDLYVDQIDETGPSNTPLQNPDTGSPPEGREPEPDDPANTGEPTIDDQDPPRGDDHDDEVREIINELRTYRTFVIKRIKNGKKLRKFVTTKIPEEILRMLDKGLTEEIEIEDAKNLFEEAIGAFEEAIDGGEKDY